EEEGLVAWEGGREGVLREGLLGEGGGGVDEGWEVVPGDGGDGVGWAVPSLEEVEVELLERRKRRLIDQL
ncbi:hypothetical protein EJ03DRAFT_353234, partial [Teratosphaeria nubilosa]